MAPPLREGFAAPKTENRDQEAQSHHRGPPSESHPPLWPHPQRRQLQHAPRNQCQRHPRHPAPPLPRPLPQEKELTNKKFFFCK